MEYIVYVLCRTGNTTTGKCSINGYHYPRVARGRRVLCSKYITHTLWYMLALGRAVPISAFASFITHLRDRVPVATVAESTVEYIYRQYTLLIITVYTFQQQYPRAFCFLFSFSCLVFSFVSITMFIAAKHSDGACDRPRAFAPSRLALATAAARVPSRRGCPGGR